MKSITSLAFMLLTSISAFAQETAPASQRFLDDPFNSPMLPFYLVTALVFVVAILVALVAILMMRVLNMMTEEAEKQKAEKAGIAFVPKQSWFSRFMQKINASVPMEKEKEIELDHNYDGIRELDNHLPPWWKWLFYGTIAWGIVYFFVFHVSHSLPLSIDEYQNEIAAAEEQALKIKASQPQATIDENTLAFTNDATLIEKGKSVFMNNNCGSCHRNDGGGNAIGPNLTDQYWIHGGDIKSVFTTIKNGVVEKGMPAWGKAMSPQDVRDVAYFIMSIQGTNPANAKAPQGELFTPAKTASDSTQASL